MVLPMNLPEMILDGIVITQVGKVLVALIERLPRERRYHDNYENVREIERYR